MKVKLFRFVLADAYRAATLGNWLPIEPEHPLRSQTEKACPAPISSAVL